MLFGAGYKYSYLPCRVLEYSLRHSTEYSSIKKLDSHSPIYEVTGNGNRIVNRKQAKVKVDIEDMAGKVADKSKETTESLSYVKAPQQLQEPPEEFRDKLIRRTKENPLVPIGT